MKFENMEIRKEAAENDVSLKAIAEYIGVSPEYLSRCMSKPLNPRMKVKVMCALDALKYEVAKRKDEQTERMNRWIEDRDKIVCPKCGSRFNDEIVYMSDGVLRFCPSCGEKLM